MTASQPRPVASMTGLSPSQSRARRELPLRPLRDVGAGTRGGVLTDDVNENCAHQWVVAALLPVSPDQARRAILRHKLRFSDVTVEALDVYCKDCRLNIADATKSPCPARRAYSSGERDHLAGGPLHERARRVVNRDTDKTVVASRENKRLQRSRASESARRTVSMRSVGA